MTRAQSDTAARSERGHSCPQQRSMGKMAWELAGARCLLELAADRNVRAPVAVPGCAQMNVRSGSGIKAAFLTSAMEADPSSPQAPPSTLETLAAKNGELDLPIESPPPVPEGPERRLAAGLGQAEPMRGQTLSTGRRKPAGSRRSGRRDTAPAEAGTAPETANPIFQQALEILRREVPPPGQVQSLESKVQSPTGEVQGPKSKVQSPKPAGASTLRTQTLPTLDFRPETLDCAVPPSALATQIIPARMLNEFVYCPRLFYYEFVESVFMQSADTLRGKALHRRVDSGKGDLPAAAGKEEGRRGQKSEDRGQRTEDGLALGAAPSTLNPQPSTEEVIHSR